MYGIKSGKEKTDKPIRCIKTVLNEKYVINSWLAQFYKQLSAIQALRQYAALLLSRSYHEKLHLLIQWQCNSSWAVEQAYLCFSYMHQQLNPLKKYIKKHMFCKPCHINLHSFVFSPQKTSTFTYLKNILHSNAPCQLNLIQYFTHFEIIEMIHSDPWSPVIFMKKWCQLIRFMQ